MNSACEVCDANQPTIKCMDCDEFYLYCQKCYEISHKCDSKKSHKTQAISAVISVEEDLEELLFCQEHEEKYKEYSCLTCNQAICSDCLTIGKHIGHETNNIQKGYEKVIADFKTQLSEYEETLKLLDAKKTPIINTLNNALEEIKSTKQEMIEDSQSLINIIEEKTKEMITILDNEIESFTQNVKTLQKSSEEFKGIIEKCSESIKKAEAANHENYYKFSKNIKKLENTKELFNKWLPIASLEKNKYVVSQLEPVKDYIANIKEVKTILVTELESLFDKNSIVSMFDHKIILLSWISEACKTPKFSLDLLWKGTVDGFSASSFHENCDNQGTTVTVILSEFDCIFGGFTTKSWANHNKYTYDPEAFIFSLTHKTKLNKQKNTSRSIFCSTNYGPIFGGGSDISICDNCNNNNNSYSNGNHTYNLPEGVDNKTYLAGACNFKVKDIEVYSVKTY